MAGESNNTAARESIFQSIRAHLAASAANDALESEIHHEIASRPRAAVSEHSEVSLIESFQENVEAVDGHCIVARNESEVLQALADIITKLHDTKLKASRIAISDAPEVERLLRLSGIDFAEVAVAPSASDVFGYDVGISRVQAGIAETGTLLLDSSLERHRLVSLVPPVHIAIIDASQLVATLGEALARLREVEQVSPIVTLVTGPSRTADIELTLAIGVHGPQELFVIVNAAN